MINKIIDKVRKKFGCYPNINNVFDYNYIIRRRSDHEKCLFSNNFYGVSYCLKRYSGYSGRIRCVIEHGMPHTFDNAGEFENNKAKVLLVCSEERMNNLKKFCRKKIIPIGPHIAYARSIYDENAIQDTKENLGKTLLVYPMHSIEDYHFTNATKEFIKFIDEIKEKNGFDTVLVSVYFVDIQRGLHIPYLQKGWQVVSAGDRMNYDFMDVQRTIMELSDLVVCQGYSSALGYAGYLKKPIIFKDMELKVRHDHRYEIQDMWGQYKARLSELFSEYAETIDDEQYLFLNKLYGYDCVKSAAELKEIFANS